MRVCMCRSMYSVKRASRGMKYNKNRRCVVAAAAAPVPRPPRLIRTADDGGLMNKW